MYNDKPWRKNIPTSKEFIVDGDIDFYSVKSDLIKEIDNFYKRKNQTDWPIHPIFGKFTKEQYGKMNYKHLDHHLSQFGV